jgi:hypothetical protein
MSLSTTMMPSFSAALPEPLCRNVVETSRLRVSPATAISISSLCVVSAS